MRRRSKQVRHSVGQDLYLGAAAPYILQRARRNSATQRNNCHRSAELRLRARVGLSVLKVLFGLLSLCALSLPVCAQNNAEIVVQPGVAPTLTPPVPTAPSVVIQQGPQVVQPLNPQPALNSSGGLLLSPGSASSPITVLQTSTPKGSLLCSDPALLNNCGYEKADKLGVYKLNLQCSDGFYDPIWGGSCWKCPDGFIRSANNVQNDDACWRVPPETTAAAQRVKNTPWAWECPSGTFWDIYDRGACWQCPDDHPRRTAYAVWDSRACATPVNETQPAAFLKFNGCPSLQQALADKTLTLNGKRMPGRPFLDIGAGWSQGQASGLCYACPTIDDAGNFLITDRTLSAVTSDQACAIRLKYKPGWFAEPGLAGLGAASLIADQKILDPASLTAQLYLLAAANNVVSNEATTWVPTQWKAIAAFPYKNQALQTVILRNS